MKPTTLHHNVSLPRENTVITRTRYLLLACALVVISPAVFAANALQNVSYSSLSGDAMQITLQMEQAATEPLVFTIDSPARIALDLTDTANQLSDKNGSIGIGVVNGYSSAEAGGRTRVVINLTRMTSYEVAVNGNTITLTLGNKPAQVVDTMGSPVVPSSAIAGDNAIRGIDFSRGESGEGLIHILLPSAKTSVDMHKEGDKLIVDFLNTTLPNELQRSLDVKDFATPVFTVDTFQTADGTRMEIRMDFQNEHLAYQSNEDFIIEVKPLDAVQEEARKKKGYEYTGEKLSLNFQDIAVRSVLQLLADFTGLNVVVSDTVGGSLTLRLKNVPWDQALDIILRTKGLAQRTSGNVILIAPAAEIANAERLELQAAQQVRELEQLVSEFIQINYADAADLSSIISSGTSSLLTARGAITVDPRTNILLVRETPSQIAEIRNLIAQLDVPVKQVLIESRIVSATDTFSKDLGVRFGYERAELINSIPGETPFTAGNDRSYSLGGILADHDPTIPGDSFGNNLLIDLPAAASGASIGLAIGKVGTYLLQLELSALQAEGRGEVISNPRLITADKHTATIQTGTQIPYQEASSSGATTTSFQSAVLSLSVTPQITPDNRIIMDLTVTKDSVSDITVGGVPAVNTQSLSTNVIVDNGETIVLGGVYERTVSNATKRVPFFSDLPYIGWAFRSTSKSDNKTELLIFVTPRILKDSTQLN